MKSRIFGLLTAAVFAAAAIPVMHASAADKEYEYKQEDGMFASGWNLNDQGEYGFRQEENGVIIGSWERIHHCRYQCGKQFPEPAPTADMSSIRVSYNADLQANGSFRYGIYGTSAGDDPFSFYVIEGQNEWTVPEGMQAQGTVTVDDVCYDLYSGRSTADDGVMQYWSVRHDNTFIAGRNNVCIGYVILDEHIRAWQALGAAFDRCAVSMVSFEAVAFGGTAGSASGNCVFNKVNVTVTASDAEEITDKYLNQRDDGTYLEAWKSNYAGALYYREETDGGCFGQWDGVMNCYVRNGMQYPEPVPVSEQDDIRVRYEAALEAKGTVWYNVVGMYQAENGWDGEFYIVDGWNGYRPCSDDEPLRTVEIGGVLYDIYHTVYIPQGIDPPPPVPMYWSIRQENAYRTDTKNLCKAEIPLSEHIRAWDSVGAKTQDWALTHVFFEVNGYGGMLRDASGICTLEKTKVTFTAAERTRTGDANCDGFVDIADAVLILRYAAEDAEANITDQGVKNGDTDQNGQTDGDDAALILRYIAKQITL